MLTILSVGYPLATVGPDSVGGAEQVLAAIDRAIVAAGHRSLVIAPDGSTCAGELIATTPPVGRLDEDAFHRCHASCRAQLARTLAREHVDVIHMHGPDFPDYLPDTHIPVLGTLHLWPTAYPRQLFNQRRPNLRLQCVSEAQRQACPANASIPVSVIRNGVDVDAFAPSPTRDDFVLVLGRICPEKGIHVAIDAARAAGLPLVVAGAVFPYPSHQRYFETTIAPRLGDDVRLVGALHGAAKRQMLARARCVVIPSLVPETSSLAAMEALASGTPVVALRSPALSELIEDGSTGFVVATAQELPDAMTRAGALSGSACRAAAVERCSQRVMTQKHLDAYHRVA